MSLEAHHLAMGNPIIGSRQITDTNSGPVTFNRPAQTHNPIIRQSTGSSRRITAHIAHLIIPSAQPPVVSGITGGPTRAARCHSAPVMRREFG